MKKQNIIVLGSLFFMCSCAITSSLERESVNAGVTFIPKEIVEKKHEESKQVMELRKDSTTYFLAPATTDENGEQIITLDIAEVVVVAKSRTLPERKGKVAIDFVVTLPKELQGSCQSVTVTPLLHKLDDAQPLQDLSIRGELFSRVQDRNYWQFERYVEVFKPNAMQKQRAYERFIKYPYPKGVRLDSIVESHSNISYYYTQDVPTKGEGKRLLITLKGEVLALDGSIYTFPKSDTLTYNISSMLNFADTTTRYITRVIAKYAVVNDRNYLTFKVNDVSVIDTLSNNAQQLERIEKLMDELINQNEFHVDSIVLIASASPEGSYSLNNRLAKGRALSLKQRLVDRFGSGVDSLITVRWVAEDWAELSRIITQRKINNYDKIVAIINKTKNPDSRELAIRRAFPKEYAEIRKEIYPKLRAVNFKYDLRRVGMLKDTIYTTTIDTVYARGMQLLNDRQYSEAFSVLNEYRDHNCALAMMSLGYDKEAYEILSELPQNAKTYYLRAILCSRLGKIKEGRECFIESCNLDNIMKFRGKLDPEISNLLKENVL